MKLFLNFFFALNLVLIKCEVKFIKDSRTLVCDAILNLPKLEPLLRHKTVHYFSNMNGSESNKMISCFREFPWLQNLPFTVSQIGKQNLEYRYLMDFVVMVIDPEISSEIQRDRINPHGNTFIIYTKKPHIRYLKRATQSLWDNYIYNVIILMQSSNFTDMATYYPFTENKCRGNEIRYFNKFENGRWVVPIQELFSSKLRNFHHCKIIVNNRIHGKKAPSEENQGSFKGSEAQILRIFAGAFNMTIWFQNSNAGNFSSYDILTNFFPMAPQNSLSRDHTMSYFSNSIHILIYPRNPLTPFEKLLLPFENPVWIVLAIFFTVVIIILTIIKFLSRRVQHLFFERTMELSSIWMELLVDIFGGSHHILPAQNFARVLLISFTVFCLIFRTAYISTLYQYLQVCN